MWIPSSLGWLSRGLMVTAPAAGPVDSRAATKAPDALAWRRQNANVPKSVPIVQVSNMTLAPITKRESSHEANGEPNQHVKLHWGIDDNAFVQVGLAMSYSTVVLEDVPSVKTVHCDLLSNSVLVTFDSVAGLTLVTGQWQQLKDEFVLITNHLGDCDSEFERGFFLADVDTMAIHPATKSIRLLAQPTKPEHTGKSIDLTFADMPTVNARDNFRRGITFHKNNLTLTSSSNLDPGITLGGDDAAPFNVVIDHLEFKNTVTFSGVLKYSIHDHRVTEFWVDVTKNLYHKMDLTYIFPIPFVKDIGFDIPVVSIGGLHIPGIIHLGPELTTGLNVFVDTQGEVQVHTSLSSTVANGHAHVDFLNSDNSDMDQWDAVSNATANVSVSAALIVFPSLRTTFQLACSLFGKIALDLSTGVQSDVGVQFVVGATRTRDGFGTGNITLPEGENCPNGFGYSTDFLVQVTAFATAWAQKKFTPYDKPIGSYCLPWVK